MEGVHYRKATQLLALFAQKNGGKLNKLKVIKLMWLCDRLHLGRYGRTITGDTYFALKFGPVGTKTRDLLNDYQLEDVESEYVRGFFSSTKWEYKLLMTPTFRVLSDSEIEVADEVWGAFEKYDGFKLAEYSHTFPEWKRYQIGIETGEITSGRMYLTDFFKSVKEDSGLFSGDEEGVAIAKEIFEEKRRFFLDEPACV